MHPHLLAFLAAHSSASPREWPAGDMPATPPRHPLRSRRGGALALQSWVGSAERGGVWIRRRRRRPSYTTHILRPQSPGRSEAQSRHEPARARLASQPADPDAALCHLDLSREREKSSTLAAEPSVDALAVGHVTQCRMLPAVRTREDDACPVARATPCVVKVGAAERAGQVPGTTDVGRLWERVSLKQVPSPCCFKPPWHIVRHRPQREPTCSSLEPDRLPAVVVIALPCYLLRTRAAELPGPRFTGGGHRRR